jgi:hypothetical protein
MSFECSSLLPRAKVPESDRLVEATRRQRFAVGRKDNRIDWAFVALQHKPAFYFAS